GSDPIVGPDGTVYVSFWSQNTLQGGTIDQYLVVSCPPTADCSQAASWTAPSRITKDLPGQPFGPDSTTGCPAGGHQCLPPNGYRTGDDTAGSLSVDNSGHLYFVWADFRNGGGTCPQFGNAATSTPPCNNDVFYTASSDGGHTWASVTTI